MQVFQGLEYVKLGQIDNVLEFRPQHGRECRERNSGPKGQRSLLLTGGVPPGLQSATFRH
jgi:hypothetical protein